MGFIECTAEWPQVRFLSVTGVQRLGKLSLYMSVVMSNLQVVLTCGGFTALQTY